MLRKILYASITLFALTLLSTRFIQAQVPTGIIRAEAPECNRIVWACTNVEDLDEEKAPEDGSHRLKLTLGGLPPVDGNGVKNQFIVACGIDTKRGFVATTGNNQYDKEFCLSSQDSGGFQALPYLQQNYGYSLEFIGFSNPFTDDDGVVEVTVKPGNRGRGDAGTPKDHLCFIGYKVPEEVVGNDPDGPIDEVAEEETGMQYGSFRGFQGVAACVATYFDPYGRVYNEDLKPVPGVDVSLFNNDTSELVNLFGIPNPTFTGNSGIFNFNTPAGRYNLTTTLPNATEVHPNHSLAFTTPPYVYGDIIVETGDKAEQRDIPVVGGSQPVLELSHYAHLRTGDKLMIYGSATWPLTIVDLIQGSTSIEQIQADRFGNFYFALDPGRLDPTQQVTVKLTEVDLTLSADLPAANPATDEITFDPIPSYLEGFAYINGKIAPFATVRVRLELTDGIHFETKADKDGFFSILPKDLPIMPFYLEYIPAQNIPVVTGGTDITGVPNPTTSPVDSSVKGTVVTVPEYAKQNKEYHDTNVIDIMAGTKNGTKVDPLVVDPTQDNGTDTMMKKDQDQMTNDDAMTAEQSTQQRYLTLLILVVLLIFVGTGAVLLLRKKGRFDHLGGGDTYEKDDNKEAEIDNPTGE